jgi:Tol biopolymer transport system component
VLDIYVLDLETGEETQLTDDAADQFDPVWSPDGTQIAFVSNKNQEASYCTLWVMNADGSDPRPLLDGEDAFNLGPTWSPDGKHIAFQSNRDGNFEVHIFEIETGDLTNLTRNPNLDANPAWSPDGSTIAFTSDRSGNPEIWLVNADGTGARQVTDRPMLGEWRPAWSPDGQTVAFESFPTVPPRDIVIQEVEAGTARELETPSSWNMWPSWPTNDLVLFASSETFDEDTATGSPADLYLMDINTGETVRITSRSGDDGRPTWRP